MTVAEQDLRFNGTLDELKDRCSQNGLDGSWTSVEHGHQLKLAANGGSLTWFPSRGKLSCQGTPASKAILVERIERMLALEARPITSPSSQTSEKVFVVHGHDRESREQLELILLKLGLKPFILMNDGGSGLTIIEALEREITSPSSRATFGIVLLTPDDLGYQKTQSHQDAKPRARQNVVLEMGMLLAALTRGRVAILKKGYIEDPTDTQGILYIPYNDHVREAVPKLAQRLNEAGFKFTTDQLSNASA